MLASSAHRVQLQVLQQLVCVRNDESGPDTLRGDMKLSCRCAEAKTGYSRAVWYGDPPCPGNVVNTLRLACSASV